MSPKQAQPAFDAPRAVDGLLAQAAARGASDLHLEPTASGYEVKMRVDGLLAPAEHFDAEAGRAMVSRLMVQAQMLTYRLDVPQEGRLSTVIPTLGRAVELRLAVMPTTHGLRAAVRLPAELAQPRTLDELGLPDVALMLMRRFLAASSGMMLLTGPAGSGKTTIIYALLEELARTQGGLSIISLEDPVERDLPGVTQIEVRPFGELTYDKALRSILRQDPQVLALGEVRDAATASIAIGAAMGGHRLLSTLHAATPGGALVRLLEMGIEPYQLTSGLLGVASVRLLRRRSDGGEGYAGRIPVAQVAWMDEALRAMVMQREPATRIDEALAEAGGQTLHGCADALIKRGLTDEAEARRVLGEG